MMRYAQTNTDNICVAVSDLNGEVTAANMIQIADDAFPIGKKWENGTWNDVAAPTVYKILTKLEAYTLLMVHGGMTKAEIVAANNDPELAFEWLLWAAAKTDDINRNSPNTAAVLAALRDNGYITQGELDAIMANWPTE